MDQQQQHTSLPDSLDTSECGWARGSPSSSNATDNIWAYPASNYHALPLVLPAKAVDVDDEYSGQWAEELHSQQYAEAMMHEHISSELFRLQWQADQLNQGQQYTIHVLQEVHQLLLALVHALTLPPTEAK